MNQPVRCAIILLLLSLIFTPLPLRAAQKANPLTAEDVGAFLDGFMPMQLQREDIAGAVVVVVKDGEILFARGYGFADVKKRRQVGVENTLFRPGSISKLFTWTSVMQMVEQGKLDLDRDVNAYIDFKIPPFDSKPITLRNIMTHTPGFEETAKELFVAGASGMPSLSSYLKDHLPQRIFPPGVTPAYSNYATAVAGYIVSRVAGKPFEDYVAEAILKPLGMTHSTFVQPLPANLKPLMSNGYQLGSDDPKEFEVVTCYPAGSLSTSGADMAKFMIAHLQNGKYKDAQILRPETARIMQSRQITYHELQPGMALGFYEENSNGMRIIGHGGDTMYFHSDLHLIPEKNLGFFVSYNSAGKGEISTRTALWEKFMDRYFPYDGTLTPDKNAKLNHAKEVAGYYLSSRRSDGDILHLLWRLTETHVSARPDDTIEIGDFKDYNGKPKYWREVKPFVFQELNGPELIAFKQQPDGTRLRLITRSPIFVFDRVAWYENSLFLLILSSFTLTILVLTILLWPVTGLVRRHYETRLELTPAERRARLLTRIVCLLDLIFLIGLTVIVAQGFEDITKLTRKTDVWIHLFQITGLIGAIGAIVAIYSAYRFWMSPKFGFGSKLLHMLIALACIGFVWLVLQGHMLNFNLQY